MKNLSDMLCSTLLLFCFLSSSKVDAWGGLFNRFNPSMLSDLGYGGGSYGKELYSAAHSGVGGLISLVFSIKLFLETTRKYHHYLALCFIYYSLHQIQSITVQMKNQRPEAMVAQEKCVLLMNIVVTNTSVQMPMKVSISKTYQFLHRIGRFFQI